VLLVLEGLLSEIPMPNSRSAAIIKNAINGTTRGDEVLHQLGCLGGAALNGLVTNPAPFACGLFCNASLMFSAMGFVSCCSIAIVVLLLV
jgi:hypothetical protein